MLIVIYLVAITVEAMSGALAAGRRNMDIFGVAVIAFVTALGGGTIRDLILGHFPILCWRPDAASTGHLGRLEAADLFLPATLGIKDVLA
jgi:uncharacterized membrane protein YeiH